MLTSQSFLSPLAYSNQQQSLTQSQTDRGWTQHSMASPTAQICTKGMLQLCWLPHRGTAHCVVDLPLQPVVRHAAYPFTSVAGITFA